MLAGLSAIATDNLFSFSTERIEHSLYMFIMGGMLLGVYSNLDKQDKKKPMPIKNFLLILMISIVIFNFFLGKKKYEFEKHWKYAKYYYDQGRYQEALSSVEKGKNSFFTMEITGNPIEIYSGRIYLKTKKPENAIKEFSQAAIYNPTESRIYSDWGTAYSEMKQYDKAIELYKKGLKLTPEYVTLLKNLAVNYFHNGNYGECIETIGKLKTEGDQPLINLLNEAKRKLTIQQETIQKEN